MKGRNKDKERRLIGKRSPVKKYAPELRGKFCLHCGVKRKPREKCPKCGAK